MCVATRLCRCTNQPYAMHPASPKQPCVAGQSRRFSHRCCVVHVCSAEIQTGVTRCPVGARQHMPQCKVGVVFGPNVKVYRARHSIMMALPHPRSANHNADDATKHSTLARQRHVRHAADVLRCHVTMRCEGPAPGWSNAPMPIHHYIYSYICYPAVQQLLYQPPGPTCKQPTKPGCSAPYRTVL